MNSDNYEFSKSSAPQSVGDYSAYANKQWNSLNDLNSGVYQNTGLTLVQWDLTSIYNGQQFTDISDLYMAVPLVMCATCSNGANILAPPTAAFSLCTLKSNYQHLIHQIEIVANGKTVSDMQPFISIYKHFKLLSELSATDLKNLAPSLGLSESVDNEKSAVWTTAMGQAVPGAAGQSKPGIGLCNNLPYSTQANNGLAGAMALSQNTGATNDAILKRASKIVDATGSVNNFVGAAFGVGTAAGTQPSIVSITNLTNEYKPVFQTSNNVMSWTDVGLIPLKFLCDVIDKMGLVKKCDLQIRAWFNTGSIQVAVSNPTAATLSYGTLSSSFTATCPLTINYLPYNSITAAGAFTANTNFITAGLFIADAPSSIGINTPINVSAASSILSNPMKSCRIYYSQVMLTPQKAISYVEANQNKQVVYENVLFNQYSSITAGSSFSQLVQSGIKNPIGVAIIPFISATNLCGYGQTPIIGFNQYASPYDTCPATYSPLSLTNLQITLGGVNVLNSSMFYTYENFLTQVALAETLTSSDIGINTGLINQSFWENNRVYWVDLGRGAEADKATARNLNISFTNNSLLTIDVMVFTVYLNRLVLNVETGAVKVGSYD